MSFDCSSAFYIPGCWDRVLPPGAFLFHQGEAVTAMFLVTKGEVQLTRHQRLGQAIVLQQAKPGDILAEASAFAATYHCDGIAHSKTTVRGMAKGDFLKLFRENANFAQAWAAQLAREVQTTRLRSEILSLKTVTARLDAWLNWHGPLPEKGEWIHIARQIAVSPEALYREIAKRRRRPDR